MTKPPQLVSSAKELRDHLDLHRLAGRSVGFVPTMGYLHAGHGSLITRAGFANEIVAASIFVNPLQFGAAEDLDAYPRDLERDVALAEAAGVDVLFVPPHEEIYPEPVLTTVTVPGLSEVLEGETRPDHFAGVCTVVIKLFNIVGPCRAYFGEKDYQQLAIIAHMANDLSFPVEVVGCPTVRETDGLAMSSRNSYLSRSEREAAPVVHKALQAGAATIEAGETRAAKVRELMAGIIEAEPLAKLDYVAVVDADSLAVPNPLQGNLRLLAAVGFGRARLIDNVGVTV